MSIFSVDQAFLSRKENETLRFINESAPAIVWLGNPGILIIAASRNQKIMRIDCIHDRIACVVRGHTTGRDYIVNSAINRAGNIAFEYSKGDVHCEMLAKEASMLIDQRYNDISAASLKVEAIFAGLDPSGGDDYVAHINFEGLLRPVEKVRFFGTLTVRDARSSQLARDNEVKALNEYLESSWSAEWDVPQIMALLRSHPSLQDFFAFPRIECVLLDRKKLANKQFKEIFKRLD